MKKLKISTKHLLALPKKYGAALAVVVVLALLATVSVYAVSQQLAAETNGHNLVTEPKPSKAADIKPSDDATVRLEEPKATASEPAPAITTPSSSPAAKSAPTRSSLLPLQVIRVIGGSYTSCSGAPSITLTYAYAITNASAAGTIHWQVEERQAGAVNVLGSGDAALPERTGSYEISNPSNYQAEMRNGDTAIRLHITQPNDIASPWYGVDDNNGMGYCPGY